MSSERRSIGALTARTQRPLWRCPKCGHRFVTKNLWHSCGHHTLAEHFSGKPPALRSAFNRWVAVARAAGPVTVYAQKTRIVLQRRVRFAGTVVRKTWLDTHLWLRRRVEHPLLVRTEDFGRLGYGHHFRVERPSDIDAALQALMREAYAIGAQGALAGAQGAFAGDRGKISANSKSPKPL